MSPVETLNGIGGYAIINESTQPRFDGTDPSGITSDSPLGPGCVDNSVGTTRGGTSLDRPFFKIWAAEALLSDDLDALTDHERSIWLFLLCAASLESPRWHARVTPNLARKCKTTEPKLRSALAKMSDLGMVVFDGSAIHMHTAERWNEETYSKPPSASPERVRERVAKHRNDRRNEGSNDPVTTPGNDVKRADVTGNKREEIREKKQEEEVREKTSDDGDSGFRERYGTLAVAFGDPRERRLIDEFEQIANDSTLEEIREGIAEVRRAGQKPYPSKVWAAISELRTPAEAKRSLEDFMESMYEPA